MFAYRNFFHTLVVLSLVAFAALRPARLLAEFDNDNRSWQTLGINFYEDDNWRFKAAAQTRLFDDSKFMGVWLIAPTAEYKINKNWDVGTTYLMEDARAEAGDDYTRLHIFWLHISPHWNLSENTRFAMRHTAVYRAVESHDNYWVSRHLFDLSYALHDYGPLVGVGIDTEVFYNYDTDRLNENRFKPLKLTFALGKQAKLQLYGMLQSKRFGENRSWDTAYVFGQTISYKF
ncbi:MULTISPECIES: DUF2490 domain-containing protein [unclassified Lentimonas]|uniref:DUF2490 domain-containing protein n=1 Tax=unclassified Lentimonas TaxID=2630993 RepID=UPI001329D6F5|nr:MULTISPECIES: DUF2490 domain-containing protein [unclassified Lentimonas]CAA6676404.1 Unannotated [Lentimonas sp. CC4]CAA6685243.1 Unannotated [Lentimonas sp. CC6]CAA7075032.1 Unannotated [Lentimonas sp. CC4]CAA7169664.1 Unannotated [Lentimonas sp. CC21]CAA7182056.1 Unannotated [Lentimonas sp. CC8]